MSKINGQGVAHEVLENQEDLELLGLSEPIDHQDPFVNLPTNVAEALRERNITLNAFEVNIYEVEKTRGRSKRVWLAEWDSIPTEADLADEYGGGLYYCYLGYKDREGRRRTVIWPYNVSARIPKKNPFIAQGQSESTGLTEFQNGLHAALELLKNQNNDQASPDMKMLSQARAILHESFAIERERQDEALEMRKNQIAQMIPVYPNVNINEVQDGDEEEDGEDDWKELLNEFLDEAGNKVLDYFGMPPIKKKMAKKRIKNSIEYKAMSQNPEAMKKALAALDSQLSAVGKPELVDQFLSEIGLKRPG